MVSFQVNADISLEEVRAVLTTLALASGEGFIAIDDKNLIVLASPALEALWGYDTGTLIGKPVQTLMPLRHRKDHTAGVRRFVLEDRQTTSGHWSEVNALHRDGREFPIHLRFMRVQHEGRFLLAAAVRNAAPYQQAHMALEEALTLAQQQMVSPELKDRLQHAVDAVEQLNVAND
ncbi:MAG: PAS domain S-box protein [Anaerolineae bacterium]|nr:PAS domain S-box protein [Anaerolineae bacterium]